MGARSSIPSRASRLRGVAQSVRAPACHAGGRGFESRHSRHRIARHSQASQSVPRFRRVPSRGNEAIRVNPLLAEYFPILIFLGIAVVVAGIAVGASYVRRRREPNPDKNAAYECGFDPFDDSRGKFDVRSTLSPSFSSSSTWRCLPLPLGGIAWRDRRFWLLVDDAFPGNPDRRLHI